MTKELQEIYNNLSPQDKVIVDDINKLDREAMCSAWRFSPFGHSWFDNTKPYFQFFNARFGELGRFSPEISKKIEWGQQLKQLLTVTWDGDLISKTDRDNLVKKGLAARYAGFNYLTLEGIKQLNQVDMLQAHNPQKGDNYSRINAL